MHFTILATISALALGANASVVDKRILRLGGFGVSHTASCPIGAYDQEIHEFAIGQDSPACRTFYQNATFSAIKVYYWDPQCILTLYEKLDCSDSGIITGPNCWTPPGGIAAYKVTCPYRP
ncbi:hypothetical protein B0H66DRAFT_570061 [Apodospora peruviana]|uniref:Uncharacterized protein n=1 Tax=Apodospora peruviana TaxID=516989 RepID=A0AAE0HSH4_9PEZI|nr:hypothetical protein B0H66DRAFT_570061 [Apodospora peruviana]